MPSTRTLVGALVVAGLVVVAAVVLVLARSDAAPVRGDLIAYSCREPENVWYAVCVVRVDRTGRKRLTERLTTTDPAWSPDGRRIPFTRNEDVGEFTQFTDDDVFVMDADGDDVRQLTPERDGTTSGQPTWSPDGREIAFIRGPSVATSVTGATPVRFGGLFVVRADGSDARRLTRGPDASPAWSPDGSEIALIRGRDLNRPTGDMDLYVVGYPGGEPRRLTNTPASLESAPAWSPDGERIAFAHHRSDAVRRQGRDLRRQSRRHR